MEDPILFLLWSRLFVRRSTLPIVVAAVIFLFACPSAPVAQTKAPLPSFVACRDAAAFQWIEFAVLDGTDAVTKCRAALAERPNDASVMAFLSRALGKLGQEPEDKAILQESFGLALRSAKSGNADGQARVADMFAHGEGTDRDYAKSFEWSQKAAAQLHPQGQILLSYRYLEGTGVERNVKEGMRLLRLAAERGSRNAEIQLSGLYMSGTHGVEKNSEEGMRFLRLAAEGDSPTAQETLGSRYYNGDGVEKNDEKAREWYLRAAEAKNPLALNNLGALYELGDGVETSYEKAISYYRQAAQLGNAWSMINIGLLYANGRGISRSREEANGWFNRAEVSGNAPTLRRLGKMYLDGDGVEPDQQKAISLLERSATKGDAQAMTMLANLEIEHDPAKAATWLRKAAEAGSPDAMLTLARRLYEGIGVEKSLEDATDLIQKYLKAKAVPPFEWLGLEYSDLFRKSQQLDGFQVAVLARLSEQGFPRIAIPLAIMIDSQLMPDKTPRDALTVLKTANNSHEQFSAFALARFLMKYSTSQFASPEEIGQLLLESIRRDEQVELSRQALYELAVGKQDNSPEPKNVTFPPEVLEALRAEQHLFKLVVNGHGMADEIVKAAEEINYDPLDGDYRKLVERVLNPLFFSDGKPDITSNRVKALWLELAQRGHPQMQFLVGYFGFDKPDLRQQQISGPGGDEFVMLRKSLAYGLNPALKLASNLAHSEQVDDLKAFLESLPDKYRSQRWRFATLIAQEVVATIAKGTRPGTGSSISSRLLRILHSELETVRELEKQTMSKIANGGDPLNCGDTENESDDPRASPDPMSATKFCGELHEAMATLQDVYKRQIDISLTRGPDQETRSEQERSRREVEELRRKAVPRHTITPSQTTCTETEMPRRRAILVGGERAMIGSSPILRAEEAIDALEKVLRQRIPATNDVLVLKGRDASKEKILSAFQQASSDLGCNDSLLLVIALPQIDSPRGVIEPRTVFLRLASGREQTRRIGYERLFLTGDVVLELSSSSDSPRIFKDDAFLWPQHIMRAVNDLRAKGVDVVLLIEGTPNTAPLDLGRLAMRKEGARQSSLRSRAGELSELSWIVSTAESGSERQEREVEGGPTLPRPAGELSIVTGRALPEALGFVEGLPLGEALLTRLTTELISTGRFETFAEFAEELRRRVLQRRGKQYIDIAFLTTDPNMRFPTTESPPTLSKAIQIEVKVLSPKPEATRGALMVETPKATVEARLADKGPVSFAMLTGRNGFNAALNVNADNYFKQSVELDAGENAFEVIVYYRNGVLGRGTFTIHFTGDLTQLVDSRPPYALVIANQNYKFFPTLVTPVTDGREVAETLRTDYGFRTSLDDGGRRLSLVLENATRQEIYQALDKLADNLTEVDRLLIYYAGHGFREGDRAYWVPVEAPPHTSYNYVDTHYVANELKEKIKAKSVLIVSDSCYGGVISGQLQRSFETEANERSRDGAKITELLKQWGKQKSRFVLSSGADEPVADGGGGTHSLFAKQFLKGLHESSSTAFLGYDIYRYFIMETLPGEQGQKPLYLPIMDTGHEGGDFVFVRTKSFVERNVTP
jgi:TPR repeat protein